MMVLFGIIAIGFIADKAGVLSPESNRHFSGLLVLVTNPLQIIASVMNGSHVLSNTDVLLLTGIAAALYVVLALLSRPLVRLFGASAGQAGGYRFLFIFSNVGYIGYPVVTALLGEDCTFYVTPFVMTYQLFCWSLGVSLISGERLRLSAALFKRLTILSALLAYAFYFIDLQVPDMFYRIVDTVGGLTSPLAMLVIGCSLAQCSLREAFGRWQIYVLAAVKLLVLPAALFFLLRPVLRNEVMLAVTVVELAMPAATNATILCCQYGGDEKLASSGVFVTTLLSMASIPLLMGLLFG